MIKYEAKHLRYSQWRNRSIVFDFHSQIPRYGGITCVQIVSNQTSPMGSSMVRMGGIGQRFISIIVNVPNTATLDVSYRIFVVPRSSLQSDEENTDTDPYLELPEL